MFTDNLKISQMSLCHYCNLWSILHLVVSRQTASTLLSLQSSA